MNGRIYIGDSFDVLRTLPAESVDSCVTDPPYGIRFMGKAWDGDDIKEMMARKRRKTERPKVGKSGTKTHEGAAFAAGQYDLSISANVEFEEWSRAWSTEVFRILKPGAHLVSFSSTRTYHRMVCGIEDAGFEIRDQLAWVFGSGFPKSSNQDDEWDGYGTALKPAWEPIVLARKPLIGTVPANLAAHRTGALNIDRCRVGMDGETVRTVQGGKAGGGFDIGSSDTSRSDAFESHSLGRWPANLMHDGSDEVVSQFPESDGQLADISTTAPSPKTSGIYGAMKREGEASADSDNNGAVGFNMRPGARRGDTGSAARFFYCAKASQEDRNAGLEYFHQAKVNDGRDTPIDNAYQRGETLRKNTHPTVKPTDLMRWLCRLVTPKGGHIIDPFLGSGSTGRGAVLEGFTFTGIEREDEYAPIARARIMEAAGELFGQVELIDTRKSA